MRRVAHLSSALLVASITFAPAAQDPARSPTEPMDRQPVGMRGQLREVVLPGGLLEVLPRVADAPLVLRIVEAYAHGSDHRYDLEYYGLEPGLYDLGELLVRVDGAPADLPPILVEVLATLPKDAFEPNPLQVERGGGMGGYTTLMWIAGVLWGVGLAALIFAGRRRRAEATVEARAPRTLADRLRPMVQAGVAGRLDDSGKAELERLLLAFWRKRLGLEDEKAARAIAALRGHEEAGELLRQLESWLHRPQPPEQIDVTALLAPYAMVPDPESPSTSPATGSGR